MDSRPHFRVLWVVVSGCLAVAAGSPSHADLAEQSPFLPRILKAAQSGPSESVELRGIMSTPEGTAFCIYDSVAKTSEWVGLNEGGYAFIVRSADLAGESVMVDYQGRNIRLVLRNAKVASSGAGITGGYAETPMGGNAALAPASSAASPDSAEENRKLREVYAAFRQRRLEREKALKDAPHVEATAIDGPVAPSNRQP